MIASARACRRRAQSGAAAVEFALVSFILFPLLLGIIDYGLWFNDSLNARQGVREVARMGVVQTVTSCSGSSDLQKLACMGTKEVSPAAGDVWVKVRVPNGWKKTEPLVVCAMIRETGVTNMTPLPNDRIIRAKTLMSIEVDETPLGGSHQTQLREAVWPANPAPPASWSGWCTP